MVTTAMAGAPLVRGGAARRPRTRLSRCAGWRHRPGARAGGRTRLNCTGPPVHRTPIERGHASARSHPNDDRAVPRCRSSVRRDHVRPAASPAVVHIGVRPSTEPRSTGSSRPIRVSVEPWADGERQRRRRCVAGDRSRWSERRRRPSSEWPLRSWSWRHRRRPDGPGLASAERALPGVPGVGGWPHAPLRAATAAAGPGALGSWPDPGVDRDDAAGGGAGDAGGRAVGLPAAASSGDAAPDAGLRSRSLPRSFVPP